MNDINIYKLVIARKPDIFIYLYIFLADYLTASKFNTWMGKVNALFKLIFLYRNIFKGFTVLNLVLQN